MLVLYRTGVTVCRVGGPFEHPWMGYAQSPSLVSLYLSVCTVGGLFEHPRDGIRPIPSLASLYLSVCTVGGLFEHPRDGIRPIPSLASLYLSVCKVGGLFEHTRDGIRPASPPWKVCIYLATSESIPLIANARRVRIKSNSSAITKMVTYM